MKSEIIRDGTKYNYNKTTTAVLFLREHKHTSDGLQAKDHHLCVTAPSEITRVWFYITGHILLVF
jgi:hypothetical protein